jgi:hypothetical protein
MYSYLSMSTPYSIPYVKKKGGASFEESAVKFYTTLPSWKT